MKVRTFLAVCLISLMVFSSAMAAPTVALTGSSWTGVLSGGEFTALIGNGGAIGLADGSSFQTFCLEKGENVSLTPGHNLYYFAVNTEAVKGGTSSSDPLDYRTAWLYSKFLDETLTGYDFNNTTTEGRAASADKLQEAIWALEDEIAPPTANTFYDQALSSNASGLGDVVVLNLYSDENLTVNAQDVLARVTPATVPAPGALLLSGLGTMVAGYLRKRRTL